MQSRGRPLKPMIRTFPHILPVVKLQCFCCNTMQYNPFTSILHEKDFLGFFKKNTHTISFITTRIESKLKELKKLTLIFNGSCRKATKRFLKFWVLKPYLLMWTIHHLTVNSEATYFLWRWWWVQTTALGSFTNYFSRWWYKLCQPTRLSGWARF